MTQSDLQGLGRIDTQAAHWNWQGLELIFPGFGSDFKRLAGACSVNAVQAEPDLVGPHRSGVQLQCVFSVQPLGLGEGGLLVHVHEGHACREIA